MKRYYAFDTKTASGKGKFFDSYGTKVSAVKAAKEWLSENNGGKAIILVDSANQPEIGISRDYVETWVSEQVWTDVLSGKSRTVKIHKLDEDQR